MSVVVVSKPPSSVRSGVPLQKRYNIQHKSDILLQEQIDKVKDTQDDLNRVLTQLEITQNKIEVSALKDKVSELREQTEFEVLKLKVVNKISSELSHVRADLEKALTGRGDIPACRKRISWLEGRMEKIMGAEYFSTEDQLTSSQITSKSSLKDSQSEQSEVDSSGLAVVPYEKTLLQPDEGEITHTDVPSSPVSSDIDVHAQTEATRLTQSAPAGEIEKLAKTNGLRNKRVKLITEEDTEKDAADQYWESEHHRFENSDISRALCDADPLSYHQVALAIPGSFLSRSQTDLDALPWRPHRKGSDIQDIHKIALNKLVARLNSMSEKVYNAAMLSVKPCSKPNVQPESSFLHNYDHGGSKHSLDESKTSDSVQRGEESTTLPRLQQKRLGTSDSGRMVFYPNPIPPPQKLPVTRTKNEIEFPRLCSYYCGEVDEGKPAERIVDQHNLYEETKFSLYHEPVRGNLDGPSITERRLRKLLENDGSKTLSSSAKTRMSEDSFKITPKELSRKRSPKVKTPTTPLSKEELSKRRRLKIKSHFAVAKAVAKLKGIAISSASTDNSSKGHKWSLLKAKGNGMEHSGLKWERVKTLVHINLVSERVDERIDAAKNLGVLRCCDAMVFYALKERLKHDPEKRVQYEAAKSLVLIGCWEEEVLEVILQYLVLGNSDIRLDLIRTMTEGKNLQYIDKHVSGFPELVKVLSHYCQNPNRKDSISFDCAVLLGKMCVVDKHAQERLRTSLLHQTDTHKKAKALEILIKQMNCTDWEMVEELLNLLKVSPVWKYRDMAAKLLILLGTQHVCKEGKTERVYELLERKLWDDPMTAVRLSVAKAITALNLFPKASDRVEKRLEDRDENCRAQAIISLGTLGMKSEKIIRQLLEMMELDSSEYVRIMIVRTFATLNWADKRILRILREKERVDGLLASEAKKAIAVLCPKATSLKSKSSRSL